MWKQSNVGGWTERTASPKASGPEPRPVQSRVGVGTLLQGTRRLWPSSRAGLQQDAAGGGGRSGPDVGLALAGTISIGGREGPSRLPSPLAAVTWLPREESVDSPVRRACPAGGEGLARPQPPALQREGEVTLAVRTAVWQVRTQHRGRCLESFLFRDSLSGR